jgi:hypothetical protein
VEALVTEIRPEERRMIVSPRRLARERERARVKDYISAQSEEGRVTIGDIAGELLRQVVTAPVASTPERPREVTPDDGGIAARPPQDDHPPAGGSSD